jgi:hypothetical protein
MSQKKRLNSSSGIAPAMISATKKPKPQQAGGGGGGGIEAYEKMGIRELVNEEEIVAGELMVLEHQGVDPTVTPTPCAVPGGCTTANLSRKKATPPHPAKKLVIKPFKGM